MSLLFSSHLLPDVEAVCDDVVVLGRGRLLAQGRIDELKQPHDRQFELRVKGDPRRLRRPAGGAGRRGRAAATITCWCSCRRGRRRTSSGRPPAEAGEQVRALRPRRSTLEEVFLKRRGGARTDADPRPGISALEREARGPRLAVAGHHPPGRPRPAQEPVGLVSCSWPPALPALSSRRSWCSGGCSSRSRAS